MPDVPYALPENTELSDWIPHDGSGQCPVPESALVHVDIPGLNLVAGPAIGFPWQRVKRYCTVDLVADAPTDHYRQGDIECIDAIRAALTDEEWRGYCKGNVLKYTWREKHKGGDGSLLKAQDYLRWALAGKAEDKR